MLEKSVCQNDWKNQVELTAIINTAITSIITRNEYIKNFGFQTRPANMPPQALIRKLPRSPVKPETTIDNSPIKPEKIPALLFWLNSDGN